MRRMKCPQCGHSAEVLERYLELRLVRAVVVMCLGCLADRRGNGETINRMSRAAVL